MQFNILLAAAWWAVFVLSTTLHEAAHSLVAWRLGDPTAYHGGQVTVNPAPHVRREPFGMVVVPLLSFALAGWMIGWASAPYDPRWAWRYPRRSALMALAGPTANLLLVIVAFILIKVAVASGLLFPPDQTGFRLAEGVGVMHGVATLLSITLVLNLILCIFNLMPVPPLDGSAVIQLGMSDETARRYMQWIRQPVFAIIGLLLIWNIFPRIFSPFLMLVFLLLYPGMYH